MDTIFDFVVHQGSRFCANAIPHSPYASMYGALVCGIDVPAGRDKALFLDTGLIHILVVSGAHLVFVEQLCAWLPVRVRLAVLGVYCWLTGFGAPVVRAFARRVCARFVEPLGWSGLQTEALTTAVLLLLFPFFLTSRSFMMSWLCALALQAPLPWPKQVHLNASLKVYVFLFPFVASSPLSILWNCLAGPLIGAILFPACLIAFVIPWFIPVSDAVWQALLWLLESGPRAPPSQLWLSLSWVWWIPFVIHFCLLIGERKWRRASAFFIVIIFWALQIHDAPTNKLIVWNTGQGQWVTIADERGCWHFDTGGERSPWTAVMKLCRDRKNFVTFSHWDWDHISFAGGLQNFLPDVCLLFAPAGRAPSPKKDRMMRKLAKCKMLSPFPEWVDEKGRTANDKSRVVFWRGVLIPGDSTSGQEKYWVHAFKNLREAKILLLGHHGSQTSTSKILLERIPYAHAAVASARFRRYGHPHARVVSDLRRARIPLLKTEDWGTLIFDL